MFAEQIKNKGKRDSRYVRREGPGEADIHEERLRVEALVSTLNGLVEHGVDEEVAGGVSIVELDGQDRWDGWRRRRQG
jgi:hypothetical protein